MPYIANILDNATGEVRRYQFSGEWAEWMEFDWAENHYSCDCARADVWEWAGGEPRPEVTCGHEIYTAWVEDLEGRRLYEDDDAPPLPFCQGRMVM